VAGTNKGATVRLHKDTNKTVIKGDQRTKQVSNRLNALKGYMNSSLPVFCKSNHKEWIMQNVILEAVCKS
jgi:hypothetical protein